MRHEVTLQFGAGQRLVLAVPAEPVTTPEAARRWLDEAFVALDCEPLRASGKVLTVDKLLAVAAAAGWQRFHDEPAWAQAYAGAALAALGRHTAVIDVDGGSLLA